MNVTLAMDLLLSLALLMSCSLLIDSLRIVDEKTNPHYVVFEDMTPCEGNPNNGLNIDDIVIEKKSKTTTILEGTAIVNRKLKSPIELKGTLYKKINGNFENYLLFGERDVCRHIGEKNKPWSSTCEAADVKHCPVLPKEYVIHNLTMDATGFPLSADTAGVYKAKVEILVENEITICYWLGYNIEPK